MGSIKFKSGELTPTLSEFIRYKSGLALSRDQILEKLRDTDYLYLLIDSDNEPVRVGSDEFQFLFVELLYSIGNISTPRHDFPTTALLRKYKGNRNKVRKSEQIIGMFIEYAHRNPQQMESSNEFDTVSFLMEVLKEHGASGVKIALGLFNEINAFLHRDAWSKFRLISWKDTKDLKDLFL